MRGRGRRSGRFGSEALADAGHAQRGQWPAALILQSAFQPLVEITRCREELLERLRRGLRARKHGKKAEAAVALRVHGLEIEGARTRERGSAEHRAIGIVGLVEDREFAEEEPFRR